MKKLILALALMAGAFSVYAETDERNDTLSVNNDKIVKVIEKESVTSKGKKSVKYYFLYDGELVPASKMTVEHYKLAKEYGARCALAMVVYSKNKRKRIILN